MKNGPGVTLKTSGSGGSSAGVDLSNPISFASSKAGAWAVKKTVDKSQNGSPRERAMANAVLGYAQRYNNPSNANSSVQKKDLKSVKD